MAATNQQWGMSDPVFDETLPEVVRLTREEGRALFDEDARSLLGISGDEFIRRLDAGEYDAIEEDETGRQIVRLLMSVSLARPIPDGG